MDINETIEKPFVLKLSFIFKNNTFIGVHNIGIVT